MTYEVTLSYIFIKVFLYGLSNLLDIVNINTNNYPQYDYDNYFTLETI